MDARVFGPLLLSAWATAAAAQEAPFGLAWGPVTDVPRPSMVDREANVTALTYLHDKPIASGADTDRVILEVCRDEGLQQVVWLSRPLSAAELPARYDAILREGTRRNGPPRSDTRSETVAWPNGRTLLAVGKPGPGSSRLVMLSRGERYDACSRAHASTTGHPANVHAGRLIDGEDGDQR
ncbi:threonyl-trna synthetase [Methylobacterium thuringiense]|uniref:Threonyl-trna synthetase n=1 Tax=Methylobacterium thuringiense TaxID=1003091 RepID=A0ABQ4THN9_9HYPH|nr:threonyl-trna synthetase [Methylobacterium thuringiense]GJE54899.1 hypothetical protein EKPJFOCH_1384 [Methylobacterium thuringiense]